MGDAVGLIKYRDEVGPSKDYLRELVNACDKEDRLRIRSYLHQTHSDWFGREITSRAPPVSERARFFILY